MVFGASKIKERTFPFIHPRIGPEGFFFCQKKARKLCDFVERILKTLEFKSGTESLKIFSSGPMCLFIQSFTYLKYV